MTLRGNIYATEYTLIDEKPLLLREYHVPPLYSASTQQDPVAVSTSSSYSSRAYGKMNTFQIKARVYTVRRPQNVHG